MNYRIDNNRIYMTLAKGDLINKTFEEYAENNKIGCAWLIGIGALENPEIGYYSLGTKSYHHKVFYGNQLHRESPQLVPIVPHGENPWKDLKNCP